MNRALVIVATGCLWCSLVAAVFAAWPAAGAFAAMFLVLAGLADAGWAK